MVDLDAALGFLADLKADVSNLAFNDEKSLKSLRHQGAHLFRQIFGRGSDFETEWKRQEFIYVGLGLDDTGIDPGFWNSARETWLGILDGAMKAMKVEKELQAATSPSSSSEIRLFISHSAQDAEFAKVVTDALQRLTGLPETAIRCTSVAPYNLTPGTAVNERLRADLRSADVVLGLLSTVSVASSYVLYELGGAWALEKVSIPLLFGEASFDLLPGPAKDTHAVRADSTTGALDMITTVCKALGVEPSIRAAGAAADDICNAAKALNRPAKKSGGSIDFSAIVGSIPGRVMKEDR